MTHPVSLVRTNGVDDGRRQQHQVFVPKIGITSHVVGVPRIGRKPRGPTPFAIVRGGEKVDCVPGKPQVGHKQRR